MRRTPPTFREQLAIDLSDISVLEPDLGSSGAPIPNDVSVRVHFVGAGTLPLPSDDPHRRRNDPGAQQFRQFERMRRDFEEAEPRLLDWIRRSPENADMFANDPAGAIRRLPRVEPEVAERLANYFGKRRRGLHAKALGVNITDISFDAIADTPAPVAPAETKSGEDIDCDAMIQIGFGNLGRIFADQMLPAIEASVARIQVIAAGVPATARLLSPRPSDPVIALVDGLLKMTIVFTDCLLDAVASTDLGDVTVEAFLAPVATPRTGGSDFAFASRADRFLVSTTEPLVDATRLALAGAIRQAVTPHLAYPFPMTFPPGLCDIATRDVAVALLPGSATTQPALAFAFSMLDPGGGQPPNAGTTSRVGNDQDGAVFLSNLLMVKAACCIMQQSNMLETLPAETHEATEAEPFCRWDGGGAIKVGGEEWDELVFFEIASVNGGLQSTLQVRNSGRGWRVTATATVTMSLVLANGEITLKVTQKTDIDEEIEWWRELITAILIAIIGAVAIIAGILLGNVPGAVLLIAGIAVAAVGLVLIFLHFLVGGLLPNLTPDQVLGLIPKEISQKFGGLSFLDSLEWDDLEFGGFLTLPGSPAILHGDEIILPRGSAIDLDSGLITPGAALTSHFDADLRLDEAPGLALARTAPQQPGTGPVPAAASPAAFALLRGGIFDDITGRSLVTLGASRMVVVEGRPYSSIGHSDLVQLVFPSGVSRLSVPDAPSGNANPVVKCFAVRTSAGRRAVCAIWTDRMQRTMLRYRTFDTPVLIAIDGALALVDTIGGAHGSATMSMSAGTFTAVPGPQWPPQPQTQYRWFWSGAELIGSGTLGDSSNSYMIAGNRCTIRTEMGADLEGWLSVFASKPSGLEAVACRNIKLIGKIPGSTGDPFGPGGPNGPGTPGNPFGPRGPGGPSM